MRVAVLGSNGYVGSTLCGVLLNQGYKVRAVDNFYNAKIDGLIPYFPCSDFEFMYGDVQNEADVDKALQDVDAVILLAAIVGFPACAKYPYLSREVNVGGAKNVIKYRDKNKPLIFASTGSVYGKIEETCTEKTIPNPLSEYGRDKLEAEQLIVAEPNTVAHRFATAFGISPYMRWDLLVNQLVLEGVHKKNLTIFQADYRRTFISILDMSYSFVYSIQNYKNYSSKVYNVGSAKNNWTKRQIAEQVAEKTGCAIEYKEIGADGDFRDYEVDYSLFEDEGWKAEMSVEDGIDELIKLAEAKKYEIL